jgi:hypothetical protein
MSTLTAEHEITAVCTICDGSGRDESFGSVCGRCMGVGRVAPRIGAADMFRGDPAGAPAAPRTYGTGQGRAVSAPTVRVNKFAGRCEKCSGRVEAEQGTIRKAGSQWLVAHTVCPKVTAAPAAPASTPTAERADVQTILTDVPGGRYALPCKTDSNDLDFWIVTVNQGRVDPSKKGRKWVARFVGGAGKVVIARPEVMLVARLLAELTAGEREQAAMLFGQQVGSCGRCGRDLTDEHSRSVGLGPTCEGKAW